MKRIICASLALIMAFLFASCSNELADYKSAAMAEIKSYADQLGEENFFEEDWAEITGYVSSGKAAIDVAQNKAEVDAAATAAKEGMDAVLRKFIETEAVGMIELITWFMTSGIPNHIIQFKHPDENAVFEYICDNGDLASYQGTIESGESISWQRFAKNTEGVTKSISHAFVDVIVRINDYIVGYAVIEMVRYENNRQDHSAMLLKSAHIPKIDDQYQAVSVEQVKAAIQREKTREHFFIAKNEFITSTTVKIASIPTETGVSLFDITLLHLDNNIVFDCIASNGTLYYLSQPVGASVSISAGAKISWRPMESGNPVEIQKAYIEVILKNGDNLVGYAVIAFTQTEIPYSHTAKVLDAALYLSIDGVFQDITEDYIKIAIEQAKIQTEN